MKPRYKQTEVGVIPEEWECPSIRDAAAKFPNAIVGGPFGSDLVSADYVESGVPVIRGQNMSRASVSGEFAFVTEKKAQTLSANLARPKDLVFTQRGTLGQVSIVPDDSFGTYLISQSQMKVSLDRSKHDPHFLHQYFTSAPGQKQIVTSAIQTGVPHTNLGILRAYRFPAPPLHEQRAIAAALSEVDALLAALDRLIAKKRDLKQAAMQQLLTGQTRLPGFQGEWVVKRLGELGTWKGGMTPSMQNPDYWDEGTVPWISSGDVKSVLLTQTGYSITPLAVKRGATTMLPTNSIVLVTRSGILRKYLPVATNVVPMAINQDIKALIPSEGFSPAYLLHALIGNGDQILKRCLKAGTTVESVDYRWLKAFSILIPPLPEQTAIAAVLSDMDAELAALEQRREKTRALKQGMMQELLTGRTRLVAPASVESPAANVVSVDFPEVAKAKPTASEKSHNWAINEAVVVAVLAKHFGSEQFPLGRKRCTKLSYLLHRHVEHVAQGYLKKAAGPYNPSVKYKGPEGIAQKNGYIRPHKNGNFSGYVAGDKIGQAEAYFEKWYGPDVLTWLEQFRRKTNDELELLATVDMAAEDLHRQECQVDLQAIKTVIRSHPEWEAKLERDIFSDANILRAIQKCMSLFSS